VEAIRHQYVCAIHEVAEQEGVPFVVMPLIEESLDLRLKSQQRFEDQREAVVLARQVAIGLEAIHRAGLIHRDLKPANILLANGSTPLISGIGWSGASGWVRSSDDGDALLAPGGAERPGTLVGAPAYMAPEQVAVGRSGATEGEISPATDVYALGVILFQMLTGQTPFEGPILQLIQRTQRDMPPAPSGLRPDLDPALESIVLRAIAHDVANRYPSARAFADALEGWLGRTAKKRMKEEGGRMKPEKPSSLHPSSFLLHPLLVVATLGLLLAGAFLAGVFLTRMSNGGTRDDPPPVRRK
jgi:serine/threonine-protein kinase